MCLSIDLCAQFIVLVYDQASEPLGVGNFSHVWHVPYIVKRVLEKVSYELVDYDGTALVEPIYGIYLNKYYV